MTQPLQPTQTQYGLLPLDNRKFRFNEHEIDYDILVIDKPEKWIPAKEFQFESTLQFAGTRKKMKIPLRGISYGEWEVIESRYSIPFTPDNYAQISESERTAHQHRVKEIQLKRRVEVFELATEKKIEGTTIEEKTEWILRLGSGELEAFFDQIINHFSAMSNGDLLTGYQTTLKKATEEISIDSLDDLLKASETGTAFTIQRPFENYLTEFPLHQLSEKRKREIEAENPVPIAPSRPAKNPLTGKPNLDILEFNYDDKNYQAKQKLYDRKQLILHIESTLPFQLPGKDTESKNKWLSQRLLGDVIKLRNYIEENLLDYRGRLDFFSSAYAPRNSLDIPTTKTKSTASHP